MPIIAIACHKGGTGKTTTAYWLARAFAAQERRTMLVDFDPLATLTKLLGINIEGDKTIADLLLGDTPLSSVVRGGYHDVRIIGADARLAWAAAHMQAQTPNHRFLLNALRAVPANYTTIIDCPPSAGNLIVNALVAATHVVIPVEPEHEAIDGMLHMLDMVKDVQDLGNGAQLLGAVITRANLNVNRHEQGIEKIKVHLAERKVPLLGIVPLRQGQDAPAKIEQAYAPIADQVIQRIGGLQ